LRPISTAEAESAKELLEIEGQFRMAIRDAVNRATRKPCYWGGLKGYRQLESIAQALHSIPVTENAFFSRLIRQVDRTLENNRQLAETIDKTYIWFLRIATCLRYPPRSYVGVPAPTSYQVKQEMEELLRTFESDARGQVVPLALYSGLRKRWDLFGDDLLHCFDIPGLPQDNLKVESLFGRLRCHQRRISGRKSTQPLRDFGHYQILFLAESEEQLLEQLRGVPVEDYQEQRKHQAQAEAPRKFIARLHRDPAKTMQDLADRYIAHLPVDQPLILFFATLSEKTPQYTC
jgi:transposase InsO family protein